MAPASRLLRKQTEDEAKDMLANLAAEAVAMAAARSSKIREETQKIAGQLLAEAKEKEAQRVRGAVEQNPKEEIHDIIKERGVHRMKLSEKLPWLPAGAGKEEDMGEEGGEREVVSPDSGVVDHLSDELPESNGHEDGQLPAIPTHLQNGGEEVPQFLLEPLTPPPDYPRKVPPQDYPRGGVAPQGDLLADNDYYALMVTT